MPSDLVQGLAQAIQPYNMLGTAIGSFVGLVVGMIPGMTISSGIIILLPLTFVLDPGVAIALLLGLYVGGMMGGSFSAILLNIPGTPSASATALDGHPMASRGEAGRALGLAICASFTGGMFSFLCLALIAPLLAAVALEFRSTAMAALLFFGLTVICSFAARSLIKGMLSGLLGLAIVTIGQDPVTGTLRYTFGSVDMQAGIKFLAAMIGLFAIPQIAINLAKAARGGEAGGEADGVQAKFGSIFPSLKDLKEIRLPTAIGAAVGSFLGILPGAGGPIAAFISYDYAKKASIDKTQFGKGTPAGIAAPEAANNAVTGGALIPMMTLGIPGDPVTAILIGALLVHGLAPGPLLFVERGDFAYGMIFTFLVANIFNLLIAFSALRVLVKILATPKVLLMPTIALLCVVGAYALRNSPFDVWLMFAFGLLGLAMRWLDMPVVPLLLALVLGREFEDQLQQALIAASGDWTTFLRDPISVLFLCLSAASITWSIMLERRQKTT